MYRIREHGVEIEIEIEDVDPGGIFSEALVAIGDVFSDAAAASGEPVTHEVVVSAPEPSDLLGEWVTELVRLAEDDDFLPERAEKLRFAGDSLRALLAGERSLPASLIRRVATERIEMRKLEDGTWSATIVLEALP